VTYAEENPTGWVVITSVLFSGTLCRSKTTRSRANIRHGRSRHNTRKIRKAFSTTVPAGSRQATASASRTLSPGNSCGAGDSSCCSLRNRLWGSPADRSWRGSGLRFWMRQVQSQPPETDAVQRQADSTTTVGPRTLAVATGIDPLVHLGGEGKGRFAGSLKRSGLAKACRDASLFPSCPRRATEGVDAFYT
jgi:hypothetical protein